MVAGVLLLTLAAGDALADAALRGTDGSERLGGLGWEDEVLGLAGDDLLYDGQGGDVLIGDTGDDFNFVECGSGNDVASVDFVDLVARNCETNYPG